MPGVSLRAMVVCPVGEEPQEIRKALAARARTEAVSQIAHDTKTEVERKVPDLDELELGALLLEAARTGNEDVWSVVKLRMATATTVREGGR